MKPSLVSAFLILCGAAACGSGGGDAPVAAELDVDQREAQIQPGERVRIAFDEGGLAGAGCALVSVDEPAVLELDAEEHDPPPDDVADGLGSGAFVFEAMAPGTAVVTLSCHDGSLPSPHDVTYTITVE
jgi:hypothetical protein